MDKITVKEKATAEYNKAQIFEALLRIENQINRGADGFLFPVKRLTSADSPYSQSINDTILILDLTSGNIVINLLPALEWEQKRITIKKTDASGNTATITANDSDLIDGATTAVLSVQYESIDLTSQGGGVWVI